MRKKHRYIIPVFFCVLLAVPLLFQCALQIVQCQLKLSAAFRMNTEKLVTISLPVQQVVWEKKEKEIVLDGEMFDIKSYTITDGIFTATGFRDEPETRIRNILGTEAKKKADASGWRLLLFLQCFAAKIASFDPGWAGSSFTIGYHVLLSFYQAPCLQIIGPPPRRR